MISNNRLDEYSERLEAGVYGRLHNYASALNSVEIEELISYIRELRRGIGQIMRYAEIDSDVSEDLEKLLDGTFK